MRKAGSRVRVSAALLDAENGYQLWSETYDRELSDVFTVQDDISRAVVEALRVKLLPGREPTTRPHRTANQEVYNHFLLGRGHYYRASPTGFRDAAAEYEKALALDGRYAPAWAGLTIPLYYLGPRRRPWRPPGSSAGGASRPRSRRFARPRPRRRVRCARDRARLREVRLERGPRGLERAIRLNPGDPHARRRLGIVLNVGRVDEGIAALKEAIALDPLSPQNWLQLGLECTAGGQLDQARSAFGRALERSPESQRAASGLAVVDVLAGQPAPALERASRLSDEGERHFVIALAAHALGREQESRGALDALVARYAHVRAFQIGVVHAARGDADQALTWLARAVDEHATYSDEMKIHPLLRSLRGDPRYVALLRRMNLPDD